MRIQTHFTIFPRLLPVIFAALCAAPALALEPGDSAPAFALPDRRGQLMDLESLKGKVVYVDFWASWCSPCKRSLPWMAALKRRFSSHQFEVLAVNLDPDRDDAERLLDEGASNLHVLFDPQGGVPERYEIRTMPTSYLIDRGGKITAVFEGFDDEHQRRIESEISAHFEDR